MYRPIFRENWVYNSSTGGRRRHSMGNIQFILNIYNIKYYDELAILGGLLKLKGKLLPGGDLAGGNALL
jgi:hypothetical protein